MPIDKEGTNRAVTYNRSNKLFQFLVDYQSVVYQNKQKKKWLEEYSRYSNDGRNESISFQDYLKSEKKYTGKSFKALDLSGLKLSNTNLSNMDFSRCDFSNTQLVNTIFNNTNLAGIEGLTQKKFREARLKNVIVFDEIIKAQKDDHYRQVKIIMEKGKLYSTIQPLKKEEVEESDTLYYISQQEFLDEFIKLMRNLDVFQTIESIDLSAFEGIELPLFPTDDSCRQGCS